MRLILGTAQLGTKYGIANKTGIPSLEEIDQLFKICKSNGIDFCDTANAYGNSQNVVFSKGMKIITKLYLNNVYQTRQDINNLIGEFGVDELDTILVHNTESLITDEKNWDELKRVKELKEIRIGFSVYTPQEVLSLIEKEIIPDVVQIPYNLFDRKFDSILKELKDLNIEIHARSLFLQGLFLLNLSEVPNNLNLLIEPLKAYSKFCGFNIHEKIKNALHFVLYNPLIDKLIVGVEKPSQLLELIDCYNSFEGEEVKFDYKFNLYQKALFNPSKW